MMKYYATLTPTILFYSFTFSLSLSHFHRWLSALTFYVSIFDTLAIENPYDLGIDATIATMLKASGYRHIRAFLIQADS